MTDPQPSPVASAKAAVESAAKAEVAKVKALAKKYWPVAVGVAIAATRFI